MKSEFFGDVTEEDGERFNTVVAESVDLLPKFKELSERIEKCFRSCFGNSGDNGKMIKWKCYIKPVTKRSLRRRYCGAFGIFEVGYCQLNDSGRVKKKIVLSQIVTSIAIDIPTGLDIDLSEDGYLIIMSDSVSWQDHIRRDAHITNEVLSDKYLDELYASVNRKDGRRWKW